MSQDSPSRPQNFEDEHPSIFNYRSYRDYLKATMAFHKRLKSLSARLLARKSGFKNSNYIKLLLDGKRKLTLESAHKLANGLGLTQQESTYLENLVLLEMLRDHPIRLEIERQISNIASQEDQRTISGDQALPLLKDRLGLIFEALALPHVLLHKVQEYLGLSDEEFSNDLRILQSFRLIRKRPDGTFVRVERLVEVSPTTQNLKDNAFKQKLLIAIPKTELPEVNGILRDLLRQLNAKYSHSIQQPNCICRIELSIDSIFFDGASNIKESSS